ncbi:RNA polymerase II-associated protein 1 [Microplitis mediator]|uniref:RNA polymerase II-associated protein 1 n=1 Tax=Microplitis mediator TaxID=375433 RepID=UPI002552DC4B|nr:RNA polymerase II-associated protein 1 [Microplitis mediator]
MDNFKPVKRPKPGDGEEELFRMQEEFMKSRQEPSAKVINLRAQCKQAATEPKTEEDKQSNQKFRSKFAERKAMKTTDKLSKPQSDENVVSEQPSSSDAQSVSTSNLLDPVRHVPLDAYKPLLGNIVEKKHNPSDKKLFKNINSISNDTGFPSVFVVDRKSPASTSSSLFYQTTLASNESVQSVTHETDNKLIDTDTNANQSNLIQDSLVSEIHKSNIEKLNNMTKEEILKEKSRLENTLDPKLLEFLRAKKKSTVSEPKIKVEKSKPVLIDSKEETKMECETLPQEPPAPVSEIVEQASDKGWVHMDKVEPEKLEWMKEIEPSKNDGSIPDEPYNARFDFDGLLLPFKDDDLLNKGLHNHGEEPDRPGYTLQELLQLSRSSAQQQRCTALTTLGNIMEKSRKGWYDNALNPAPLAALNERNIILLLRFSMDDKSVAVITATLQALRSFLSSEADEICMDRLYGWEYPDGICQVPELSAPKHDVEDISTLKDHQLAQLDSIAATMRSDIVLRIRYILSEIKPPPIGVTSALEILIRLARHSHIIALNIATTPQLLDTIVKNFIPLTTQRLVTLDTENAYGVPNVTAIRLCRILLEYAGRPVADRLNNLKIIHSFLSYSNSDAGEAGLRLAIEALRLWRLIYKHGVATDSINGARSILNSQLRFLLSNHDLTSASELSCEYAAALVALSSREYSLRPIISTLLTKWSTQLAQVSSATWSNTKLIAVTLNSLDDISSLKTEWISNNKIFVNICSSSNLLSNCIPATERDPSALPSLGVLTKNGEIQPAVSLNCCLPFLATVTDAMIKTSMFHEFEMIIQNPDVIKYFRQLVNHEWSLENSWYTRAELFFITTIVRACAKFPTSDLINEIIWKIAVKLISTLPADASRAVNQVLDIVLSNERLAVDRLTEDLNIMKLNCGDEKITLELPNNISNIYKQYVATEKRWDEAAMPKDWPYLPLVDAYSNLKNKVGWNDNDTMKINIVLSLELAMREIFYSLTPTIRFSRLVLVYLCDTVYLNNNVSILLKRAVSKLVSKYYKRLDFSNDLPGVSSFNDIFTSICECFVANSYGDEGFAMCLLVPIAQRHDVHYRKLLWSEHAGALRYLKLSPEKLFVPIDEYLSPLEQDVTLIESYLTALVRKTIRKEWCPLMYMIAIHHSAMFIRGTSKLATKMRAKIKTIQDISLAESLLNYVPPTY